jgi:hypothetical protein
MPTGLGHSLPQPTFPSTPIMLSSVAGYFFGETAAAGPTKKRRVDELPTDLSACNGLTPTCPCLTREHFANQSILKAEKRVLELMKLVVRANEGMRAFEKAALKSLQKAIAELAPGTASPREKSRKIHVAKHSGLLFIRRSWAAHHARTADLQACIAGLNAALLDAHEAMHASQGDPKRQCVFVVDLPTLALCNEPLERLARESRMYDESYFAVPVMHVVCTDGRIAVS